MGLNSTPEAERLHIGIFGRRNAGKSSLLNALTGQQLSIVSEVRGTTTDPVKKSMEILPLGPVLLIDTPGLDDEGELGLQRVQRSRGVLMTADVALLIVDGLEGPQREDREILQACQKRDIPVVLVFSKLDLAEKQDPARVQRLQNEYPQAIWVSAKTQENILELKNKIAVSVPEEKPHSLTADLVSPGGFAVLVVPIDSAAPKGRLILPQQQVIRDLLDHGSMAVVCRESELAQTLQRLQAPPQVVITDSQAFQQVAAIVPEEVPLTSFSILLARRKGVSKDAVAGVRTLDSLKDGDSVLISEGCTHHRQCDDIGTVKLPRWIREYTHADLKFSFTSGTAFPDDLSPYKMVIHCGGCMLTQREMLRRLRTARRQDTPMTNYGTLIAYLRGILDRSLRPLSSLEG